ncbi:MAG: hypothetical protein JNM69_21090 [Archangium sp.]|nr:hypothetical protein [Archangium sp.]
MRFTPARPIVAETPVEPHHRAQVLALGPVLDGSELTLEERLAADWYEPSLCEVVDAQGRAVYEVWTCDVDCGAVFVAGTTTLVAPIVQGGFAAPDLGAWSTLALAENRPSSVSWAVSSEGGPSLVQLAPGATSLSGLPRFVVGVSWPVLVEALGDEALTRFLLASSGTRRPELKGPYGGAAFFDRAEVKALAARIDQVPPNAIARLTDLFASLRRYGIGEGEGIDRPWFEAQLVRLRQVLHEGQAIAVTIS